MCKVRDCFLSLHVAVRSYYLFSGTGFKADGSLKVRPIDDESAAGVNRATAATERLRYDTLDKLFECLVRLKSETQVQPCIMQTLACQV